MPRRRPIPRRRRIFVGAEDDGERIFAQWLQGLCDDLDLHLHLDIVVAGGNDTRWVVEHAVDQRKRRNESRIRDSGALVFLDSDRLDGDRAAGRDPETVPGRRNLQLVYLRPNLEGLLVRFYRGKERQFESAPNAKRRLERLWPEYRKPMSAASLRRRFNLDDLRRAAHHDPSLRNALALLGLLPKHHGLSRSP
ncbi:MAG: hypothetical protein OXL68_07050 [Paracoccaceae bacterium]|nr:hypothetical protein [Paracoccaceae bacterium]